MKPHLPLARAPAHRRAIYCTAAVKTPSAAAAAADDDGSAAEARVGAPARPPWSSLYILRMGWLRCRQSGDSWLSSPSQLTLNPAGSTQDDKHLTVKPGSAFGLRSRGRESCWSLMMLTKFYRDVIYRGAQKTRISRRPLDNARTRGRFGAAGVLSPRSLSGGSRYTRV